MYIFSLIAMLLMLGGSQPTYAQATKDPWTTPLNLSRSGSTNNPVTVRDSNGIIHVIWQDKYANPQGQKAGYIYTRFDGGVWSQPVVETFPFEELPPILIPDSTGSIHAFWLTNDASLAYTRMSATNQGITWSEPQFIAESALGFQAVIDSNDVIHVAYIRPKEAAGLPAGVYYRQSSDRGGSWSTGKLLYPSPYFRGLDKSEANVSIASASDGDVTRVYVVWDNRARKQVFLSISSNAGENWSDPLEIVNADPSTSEFSPYGISVGAFERNILLIWQTVDPVMGCQQVYQWSADGGESWKPPAGMPTNTYGCPENNRILSNSDLIYLMTSIQDEIYLLAWNGSQWSNPEFQRTLTGFIDPETQDMVLYACQNPILLPDGQMFVVGCDAGNGGDIWATSRFVSDVSTWFPPPSIWENQTQINESSSFISSPEIIADLQGKFHAIWIQGESSGDALVSAESKRMIYYSTYNGKDWSRQVNILSSPTGDADQPSITIDNLDRLIVVWREKQSGSIYFSWANAAKAGNPSEWANPISLPVIQPIVLSPMVTVDRSGKVYVVYSIPINEDRGIYVTNSADVGETWSEPVRVVDAIAAGWEMVDNPQIAFTGDGHLHVVWNVGNVIGETTPRGIYYAYSEDEGLSWSKPMALVETPVYWSDMATDGDRTIHLAWQDGIAHAFSLRQQVSNDGGQTWSRAGTVLELGTSIAPASLSAGPGNQAFLLLIAKEALQSRVLKQWIWTGDKWLDEDGIDLSVNPTNSFIGLNSAISTQGRLGVVYSQVRPGKLAGEQDYKLLFIDRKTTLLSFPATPTPDASLQPTAMITPTDAKLVTPTSTPTVTPATDLPTPTVASGRSQGQTIVGVAMIKAVIGVVVGLVVLIIKKRREV